MEHRAIGNGVAEDLGSRLRDARRALDLTQVDLGEMLGVSAQYLSLVEQGRHPRYFDRLVEMLDAVGLALVAVPKATLSDSSDG